MSLMWRMKKPLWRTGKTVIMDSGFYVLRGFIGIFDKFFCGSTVVKKCRYWLTVIYGDGINPHF